MSITQTTTCTGTHSSSTLEAGFGASRPVPEIGSLGGKSTDIAQDFGRTASQPRSHRYCGILCSVLDYSEDAGAGIDALASEESTRERHGDSEAEPFPFPCPIQNHPLQLRLDLELLLAANVSRSRDSLYVQRRLRGIARQRKTEYYTNYD